MHKECYGFFLLTLLVVVMGCRSGRTRDYEMLREQMDLISDAQGERHHQGASADCFHLVLDRLRSGDSALRGQMAMLLSTNTGFPGKRYRFLMDAYIDGQRGDELLLALRCAWQASPQNSYERFRMAWTFVEAKMRHRLWRRPELARQIGLKRLTEPLRGWECFIPKDYAILAEQMISEDDEFRKAWEEFVAYRKAEWDRAAGVKKDGGQVLKSD